MSFKDSRVASFVEIAAFVTIIPSVNCHVVSNGGETIWVDKPFVLQEIAFG
jgi:hypothetical protein